MIRDALRGPMVPTMINAPTFAPEVLELLTPRAALRTALDRFAYFASKLFARER